MPTPETTSPASSTPAPAAAAAKPAFTPNVSDITPAQARIHKVQVAAASVPALIALLDPDAPAGKTLRAMQCGISQKGDVTITITYNP